MEDFDFNFDYKTNQLLEPIFIQSLNMIESIIKTEGNSYMGEVSKLIKGLEEDFMTHKEILTPQIHERIKNLNAKISKYNSSIESKEDNLE
jgi:hypothetical protein